MIRRRLLEDGTLGPLESVFGDPLPGEQVESLEVMNKALMLTVTDMYEENMQLQETNRNIMLAITDLYEMIFSEEEEEGEKE